MKFNNIDIVLGTRLRDEQSTFVPESHETIAVRVIEPARKTGMAATEAP